MPYGDTEWYRERVQALGNELSASRAARYKSERDLNSAEAEIERLKRELSRLEESAVQAISAADWRATVAESGPSAVAQRNRADKAETAQRAAENEAAREKDIRRRVHERFKRVRREAALGQYNLTIARAERDKALGDVVAERQRHERALRLQEDKDLASRRLAMTAYRILEAQDREDKGEEPQFP